MSPRFAAPLRRGLRGWLVGALAMGLVLAAPAGNAAAQSPGVDSKGVVLAEPGVVFIGTTVQVCVRLKEIYNLSAARRCYDQDFSGSGFAVGQGSFVTASHVVRPDAELKAKLKNYAVNKFFLDNDLMTLGSGADLEARYVLPDDAFWNHELQACYAGDHCEYTITPRVSVYPAVQIAGVSTPKPLRATVVKATGFDATDVAVLQVDSTTELSGTPTVALAASIAGVENGDPVTAIGFPGSEAHLPTGMTQPSRSYGRVSNVRVGAAGTGTQIQIDIRFKRGQSGGPVLGEDGRAIGLVSYSTLDEGDPEYGYIRTVDDIRAALKAAGVEAARGEVDAVFEQGMRYFWDRHYSAALPLFQKVLNLYDGHPQAKTYLAKAQAKAGGPEDVPLPTPKPLGKGRSLLLVGGVIAAVLLVIVLMVVLLRRRRGQLGPPEVAPDQTAPAGSMAADPGFDQPEWSVSGGLPTDAGFGVPVPGPAADPPPAEPQAEAAERSVGTVVATPQRSETDLEHIATPTPRFCSYCGNQLGPGSRFCGECGQPVQRGR